MKLGPSLAGVAAAAAWIAAVAGAGWLWFRTVFKFDILASQDWRALMAAWLSGWRIDSPEEWAFVASFPALGALAAGGILAVPALRHGLDAWRRRRWRRLAERDRFARLLGPGTVPPGATGAGRRHPSIVAAKTPNGRRSAPGAARPPGQLMAGQGSEGGMPSHPSRGAIAPDNAGGRPTGMGGISSGGSAAARATGDAYPVAQNVSDALKSLDRETQSWPDAHARGPNDGNSATMTPAPAPHAPSSIHRTPSKPAMTSGHGAPAAEDAVAAARAWFAAAGYRIVANLIIDALPDGRADFVAVSGTDVLVVVVDDVGGGWLAEEAPDHPPASVWVRADGAVERPSPVARAAGLRRRLQARHGAALEQLRIRTVGTVVVVAAGSVLNAKSYQDIWLRGFDVTVARAGAADSDAAIPLLEESVSAASDPAAPDVVAYLANAGRRDGERLRNAAGEESRIVDTKKKADVT